MTEDRRKLRDDLLHRASIGEITGKEADDEAEGLGLGRFSRRPDRSVFDPMHERFWTLPMVLAWIAYRSPDEVREYWHRYCEGCWHWIWERWRHGPSGEVHEGWNLRQRHRPNLESVALGSAWDAAGDEVVAMSMSVTTARDELWEALKDGVLIANGLDSKSGQRIDIPALDWQELNPISHGTDSDELLHSASGKTYGDVLLPAKTVRSIWEPFLPEVTPMPTLMPPVGDGYMPLYCVAQWIATEGGRIDFDPKDEAVWRAAFDALITAATADKVRIVGTRDGVPEPVPGYCFAGCRVEYPFRGIDAPLLRSAELFLRSYPYLDEPSWHGGINDALVRRHDPVWTKLQVLKSNVRKGWAFAMAVDRTGAPGRPSSMHLIKAELKKRLDHRTLESTLAAECQTLLAWFKITHSGLAVPTSKTVANSIRHIYNAGKGPK